MLKQIIAQTTSGQRDSQRAQIIIHRAEGKRISLIASLHNVSESTVNETLKRWRELSPLIRRETETKPHLFRAGVFKRLQDRPRAGRTPLFTFEQQCKLVALACETPKDFGLPVQRWSHKALQKTAVRQGIFKKISPRQVGRLLAQFEIRPHKNEYWMFPKNDPDRERRIQMLCKLYKEAEWLKEKNILVESVDEKTGIQALERIIKKGKDGSTLTEGEYDRHGTITLLAGLNIQTGEVFGYCNPTRKEEDYCKFMEMLIKARSSTVKGSPRFIIVSDQLNTHKSESLVKLVAKWEGDEQDLGIKGKSGILKSMKTRREYLEKEEHGISFRYTPKHSSWMNQVECRFSIYTRKVLGGSSFNSTLSLQEMTEKFIGFYNEQMAKPFNWTYAL